MFLETWKKITRKETSKKSDAVCFLVYAPQALNPYPIFTKKWKTWPHFKSRETGLSGSIEQWKNPGCLGYIGDGKLPGTLEAVASWWFQLNWKLSYIWTL